MNATQKLWTRQNTYRRGVCGEWMALLWLQLKAYRFLAWRYRAPVGEIDLVMHRGGVLIFVEVKTHTERVDKEHAAAVACGEKGQRIFRVAESFLACNPHLMRMDMRFDMVIVSPWRTPHHLAGLSHFLQDKGF